MNQYDEEQKRNNENKEESDELYRNIESWVKQKEDMTQVPKENVFDAAVKMDAEQE